MDHNAFLIGEKSKSNEELSAVKEKLEKAEELLKERESNPKEAEDLEIVPTKEEYKKMDVSDRINFNAKYPELAKKYKEK